MENKINKIICPSCSGSTEIWGQKNSYTLYCCLVCKLIFVNPLPDPSSIYNEDYFSGATQGYGYVNYDTDKEPMKETFNRYFDILSKYGKKSGELFDIGAATGFFLKIAKNRGYSVSGVEMSNHAAEKARNSGLNGFSGDIMCMNIKEDVFDVVTMLDVVEHMTDPFKELLEVKRILKSNGFLIINSPNGQSFLSKILKTRWHLVLPPEHLFYFSPRNLSMFMESNGFEVVYSGNIGKRFTLQYIFKTLYKWQKFSIWDKLSVLFSKGFLSRIYIPINIYDNFFIIFKKNV